MPWIIGIDEAGYGPYLGPLVMSAVVVQVPDRLVEANLWDELSKVVRRHPSEDDGRLLVDDSKLVYSTSRGLAGLELGVLSSLPGDADDRQVMLGPLIERLCPGSSEELVRQHWYTGRTKLPTETCKETLAGSACRFMEACEASKIRVAAVESVVICPPQFNELLDRWGSKGAVLAHALMELFQRHNNPAGDQESVHFAVDKHGGRNFYAPMLQNVVEDGMVLAIEEGLNRSTYAIHGWSRQVRVTFQPRADSEHFCVALASMVSKYLREVLMKEFNRFWQKRVPGLKATTGYAVDAAPFYKAIRALAEELKLPKDCLWRRR